MLEDRLRKYVEKNNLSIKEIAEKLSLRYGTVRAYIVGEREPSLEFLHNFGKEYGVSAKYILYGEGEANDTSIVIHDTIMVRYYPYVEASAGTGLENHNEIHSLIPISSTYLKTLSRTMTTTDNLYGLRVAGDSMIPRIFDGSIIIMETIDTMVYNDSIYVVRWNNQLYIKYIHNLGKNGIALVSSNPLYQAIVLDSLDDITIIGRVLCTFTDLTSQAVEFL